MFLVRPETVKLLYQAQEPTRRGRLRLDLSPRHSPRNPTRLLDLNVAREAIGERLLGLLGGLANDAVLLADGTGWQVEPGLGLPACAARKKLRVMSAPEQFEPYVVHRADDLYGLDAQSVHHGSALALLAADFFTWARSDPAALDYGLSVATDAKPPGVFITCQPFESELLPP